MWAGRLETDERFFFRGRRRASTSAPVIAPWIALMMSCRDRCRVSVRGSEIDRRFDAPMLSRSARPRRNRLNMITRMPCSP
jgi:hypothetical protein